MNLNYKILNQLNINLNNSNHIKPKNILLLLILLKLKILTIYQIRLEKIKPYIKIMSIMCKLILYLKQIILIKNNTIFNFQKKQQKEFLIKQKELIKVQTNQIIHPQLTKNLHFSWELFLMSKYSKIQTYQKLNTTKIRIKM